MIFLAILFGCLVSATKIRSLHPGPIGISLCKQMCFSTYHCEMFTYVPHRLACYFGNLTSTQGEDCMVSKLETTILGNDSMTNCQTLSKILFNRRGKLVCWRGNKTETLSSSNKSRVRELPKGYKKLNGSTKVLKHYKTFKSFQASKEHCIQDGGSLAQFKKGFDWNLFKQIYVPTKDYDTTWINLVYDEKGKQYLWGDGDVFRDSERWAPHEPSHGTFFMTEDCVGVSFGLKFRDLFCSAKQKYVCELDI